MKDMTRDTERARLDARSGQFHAIYKTHDGLDYCREDAPAYIETYADAVQWAARQPMDCHASAAVAGFEIERW